MLKALGMERDEFPEGIAFIKSTVQEQVLGSNQIFCRDIIGQNKSETSFKFSMIHLCTIFPWQSIFFMIFAIELQIMGMKTLMNFYSKLR